MYFSPIIIIQNKIINKIEEIYVKTIKKCLRFNKSDFKNNLLKFLGLYNV